MEEVDVDAQLIFNEVTTDIAGNDLFS